MNSVIKNNTTKGGKYRIAIIGAGAWGSALAQAFIHNGHDVLLWRREADTAHPHLVYTFSLTEALAYSSLAILVVSAQAMRAVAKSLCRALVALDRGVNRPAHQRRWLIASKGLEAGTGKLMSEVIGEECLGVALGAIGGPNLAREVSALQVCGITVALPSSWPTSETVSMEMNGSNVEGADDAVDDAMLFSPLFRVETSADVVGVQLWGALKNVMAIGYGLVQQVSTSENLWATFLTMAFREINTMVQAWGGCASSAFSFAGIGDLILTSCSPHGRNSDFGRHFLGHSPDYSPDHFLGPAKKLIEGAETLPGLLQRIKYTGLACPLVQGIAWVLNYQISPEQWVAQLLSASRIKD